VRVDYFKQKSKLAKTMASIDQYKQALAAERKQTAELRTTIAELQKTIDEIKAMNNTQQQQLQQLQLNQEKMQSKEDYIPRDTDEEEEIVAKETGWILKKAKKRKAQFSPEKPKTPEKTETTKKAAIPPPIILSECSDFNALSKVIGKDISYQSRLLNNEQVKLNVRDEEEYRAITKAMNDNNVQWHTYENKQTRPIRVMAKDIHPSYSNEDIKEDLINQGYKVSEVVNKLKINKVAGKEVSRTKLPMFMISFEPSEDIKKIFEIEFICKMKVRIEAIKSSKLLPQCKKCQRYGHTHHFCHREPICVKCAGNHLTSACQKPFNAPAKCSNCSEAHPASYRGCLVAKELQKRRDNLIKSRKTSNHPKVFQSKKTNNETTYAHALKNQAMQPAPISIPSAPTNTTMAQNMEYILRTLQDITARLDRLETTRSEKKQ
jgi:hypothetical protein